MYYFTFVLFLLAVYCQNAFSSSQSVCQTIIREDRNLHTDFTPEGFNFGILERGKNLTLEKKRQLIKTLSVNSSPNDELVPIAICISNSLLMGDTDLERCFKSPTLVRGESDLKKLGAQYLFNKYDSMNLISNEKFEQILGDNNNAGEKFYSSVYCYILAKLENTNAFDLRIIKNYDFIFNDIKNELREKIILLHNATFNYLPMTKVRNQTILNFPNGINNLLEYGKSLLFDKIFVENKTTMNEIRFNEYKSNKKSVLRSLAYLVIKLKEEIEKSKIDINSNTIKVSRDIEARAERIFKFCKNLVDKYDFVKIRDEIKLSLELLVGISENDMENYFNDYIINNNIHLPTVTNVTVRVNETSFGKYFDSFKFIINKYGIETENVGSNVNMSIYEKQGVLTLSIKYPYYTIFTTSVIPLVIDQDTRFNGYLDSLKSKDTNTRQNFKSVHHEVIKNPFLISMTMVNFWFDKLEILNKAREDYNIDSYESNPLHKVSSFYNKFFDFKEFNFGLIIETNNNNITSLKKSNFKPTLNFIGKIPDENGISFNTVLNAFLSSFENDCGIFDNITYDTTNYTSVKNILKGNLKAINFFDKLEKGEYKVHATNFKSSLPNIIQGTKSNSEYINSKSCIQWAFSLSKDPIFHNALHLNYRESFPVHSKCSFSLARMSLQTETYTPEFINSNFKIYWNFKAMHAKCKEGHLRGIEDDYCLINFIKKNELVCLSPSDIERLIIN